MALRRSGQVYYELASRRETIGCGYAYTNPDFADLADCNFVGEVVVDACDQPVREVQRHFEQCGVRCWRWAPAATQPPEPLGALLAPLGFKPVQTCVMVHDGTSSGAPETNHVRVVGARAMRRAYTRLLEEASPSLTASAQFRDAHLERLNEPQYDAFVALVGDEPAGVISLLQVGEIGRVCDLHVAPAWRRKRIASALLQYAVKTAQRWLLRPVCAGVRAENAAALAVFRQAGFSEADSLVSYEAPGALEASA